MTTPQHNQGTSAAFFLQAGIAFVVSFGALIIGIAYLPMDPWPRAFLAICGLFLVSSCFSLAKVVRDAHEASKFHQRIDDARLEQLYVEHNPLKNVV